MSELAYTGTDTAFTMHFLKQILVFIITWEARLVLKRYAPRVIAVTGSVGKTTTKDAIYAALADDLHVRKSAKSFNSDVGVPLTILGLENAWSNPLRWMENVLRGVWLLIGPHEYPKWLALEVGADRPGDIRTIAAWLKPDIVVLTGVPEIPVHVEFFSSPEEVLKEKSSLAEHLRPGGKIIINGDDARLRELQVAYRGACITYGLGADNDFCASHDEVLYVDGVPEGVRFRVNHDGSSVPVAVHGALGIPRVYAATAALAVGHVVGLDLVAIAQAIESWVPPPGRVRIVRGVNGSVIIDDTYNSSPSAALAALDTLKGVQAKRRIAVMGDMLELGKYSADAHRSVGQHAAKCATVLITVGFRSRAMGEAALDAGMRDERVFEYEHTEAERAGRELAPKLKKGDVVLVKGSQSMRMEKTVRALMEDPSQAEALLVRMDPEWQKR